MMSNNQSSIGDDSRSTREIYLKQVFTFSHESTKLYSQDKYIIAFRNNNFA